MKSLFASALVLLALPLCAQTASTPPTPTTSAEAPAPSTSMPAGALNSPIFASLSDAEKTQFGNAYTKAMTGDPSLQQQQMALVQKGQALRAVGTPPSDADIQAMRGAAKSFYDNLRAGMIKADSTLPPVLAKVDAHAAKLRAQAEASQ